MLYITSYRSEPLEPQLISKKKRVRELFTLLRCSDMRLAHWCLPFIGAIGEVSASQELQGVNGLQGFCSHLLGGDSGIDATVAMLVGSGDL